MEIKPVVAHINSQYFAPSETFMYYYLTGLRRFAPICLSWGPFVNLDLFPFPTGDCYWVGATKYDLRWLWQDAWWRMAKRRILAERILKRRKARLIHANYGPVGWWALPLQKVSGLPLVTTFYGYDVASDHEEMGAEWADRRQELFRNGDLFLVEGPTVRQRLIDLGCPANKVQIQRIAIDVKKLPYRPRRRRADGKVVIAFAGRFVEKKGLLYALEAFYAAWRSRGNMEFRIIGDGPEAPQVKAFIRENGLENCVQLCGFLSHPDYLIEMQRADIFLHPSVRAENGDSEGGAPTTILEAQALGMPIISTYHADIPNIVVPGQSALLSPERNTAALADSLSFLVDHPEVWSAMGRAGRNHVETFHDIEREAPLLEDKYFSLVPNGKPCA